MELKELGIDRVDGVIGTQISGGGGLVSRTL